MLKVGVIGCGAIGTELCRAIDSGIVKVKLSGIYDRSMESCRKLSDMLGIKPEILRPDDLISCSDLIVECASAGAVSEFGIRILEKGKDLMVLSAGAFTDCMLLEKLTETARKHNCRIYVPSGAVTGIDGLKSASMARVNKVTLSTTKNPAGLRGAPYVRKNNIDHDTFHEKTKIF